MTEIMVVGKKDEPLKEPTEFECTLYRLLKKKRKEMPGKKWRFLIGKIISSKKTSYFSAWVRIITNEITSVADFEVEADAKLYRGKVSFIVEWDDKNISLYKSEKYESE